MEILGCRDEEGSGVIEPRDRGHRVESGPTGVLSGRS